MIKYYRLVFKNGKHSAWSSDYKAITESAEFFGARIEEMELPQ